MARRTTTKHIGKLNTKQMQQPPPKTKTPPQQIALKQQKRLMNHL
jgi:hypothetical protein